MIALVAKRPLASGFTRRGACPALSAPMKTGDGLLVRLNPVAGGLSPAQLAGLCDAAEAHGNGVIEVTARGSIQLRGLTERSASRFAQAVDRLGISARTGVPVQTGALAGYDPDEIADPTGLAESIRAGIAKAGLEARLGPKVSVVVDGGGRTALDEVAADARLTAIVHGGSPKWLLAVAGDAATARPYGLAGSDQAACDAVLALLSEIADMGRQARARDLNSKPLPAAPSSSGLSRGSAEVDGPDGMEPAAVSMMVATDRLAADPRDKPEDDGVGGYTPTSYAVALPSRGKMAGPSTSSGPEGDAKKRNSGKSLIGITDLRGETLALGIALPFGHTTASLLKALAEKARALGVGDIRPAPRRTLVAICGTVTQADALRKQADTLGFITSPDDPRQAISACPGAPDCASGHIPARKIAAEIAKKHSNLLDGSVHLHVSGCAKGCAHPAASDLTLAGSESGIGLVVGGTARDEPAAVAENDGAGRALADVARLVSAERRAYETAAQTIQRLGLSALSEAFQQGGQ